MSNLVLKSLLIGALCCGLFSCTSSGDSSSEAETSLNNKVVYSVEFPFIQDETLLKWFPTEYTTIFNENQIYGEMNSKMNVICNKFYSDQKDLIVNQTLENLKGKYKCKMNEGQVSTVVDRMPEMVISEPFKDTVIVGFPCKVAMAEFMQDSVPAVTLYYTDQFDISQPNWFNQYKSLDKFLLGYEIEQFGMRMKLMAKEFSQTDKEIRSELVFGSRRPNDYSELGADELQVVIKKMLSDFME